MKHRGLIILAVLLALLPHVLFAESISASGSLTQSVTIDPTFAVGFTSKAITRVTELNQNKYNDSYEHVLSTVQTAPRDSSKTIITNVDNPLFLSVVTNTEVKIKIEVGKVDGATNNNQKVLTNGSTGEIPLYFYNETFLDQLQKTNQEFKVDGGSYRAVSYPLIVYVYETDVKSAPGGEYHGTIGVTISAV
ncbi:MAG: hypothetical protein ACI4NM_08595 [Bullifex sp.]